jgi:hypothetical protein
MKKEPIQTLEDLLDERMTALEQSSGREAQREQRHLEEGTSERTYWHYGYASALKDVLDILQGTGKLVN